MKLQDLFESASPMSFGAIQKVIYDLVLTKIKTDPATLSDIKADIPNDRFFVIEFDQVQHAAQKENYEDLIDYLEDAIRAVCDSIQEYYGNSMNHAPGFKKPKIAFNDDITVKELEALIDKIIPGVMDRIKAEQKAHIDNHNKKMRAQTRSVTVARMAEVAAFVKTHDKASWKQYLSVLKKNKEITDFLPKEFYSKVDEIKAIRTPEALKSFFSTLSDKEYVISVYENIMNMDLPYFETTEVLTQLGTIARSKALSAKFAPMIK